MESIQNAYRVHTESTRNPHRIHLESIWNPYGVHTEPGQNPYMLHTEFKWNPNRFHTEPIQNPYRIIWNPCILCLDHPWNPYRIHMEPMQNLCRLYTESIRNPYGVPDLASPHSPQHHAQLSQIRTCRFHHSFPVDPKVGPVGHPQNSRRSALSPQGRS
jgi:hypothetical protein